jgi:hypothetical protein
MIKSRHHQNKASTRLHYTYLYGYAQTETLLKLVLIKTKIKVGQRNTVGKSRPLELSLLRRWSPKCVAADHVKKEYNKTKAGQSDGNYKQKNSLFSGSVNPNVSLIL